MNQPDSSAHTCRSSAGTLSRPHARMSGWEVREQNPLLQVNRSTSAAISLNVNYLVFSEVLKTQQPLNSLGS